jgi:hypothetical protein
MNGGKLGGRSSRSGLFKLPHQGSLRTVRRALTLLLLLLIGLQVGPACGTVAASALEAARCCLSHCPHSSQLPEKCCHVSVKVERAVAPATISPQSTVLCRSFPTIASIRESQGRWDDISFVSGLPPPATFGMLCSRQI